MTRGESPGRQPASAGANTGRAESPPARRTVTIALTGNPNSGKTTVFNDLTGERQHVGNYPGVTVEKREGTARHGETEARIVDLPGTYSLTAYSLEEVVARNFILDETPDVVIDIVDCSNLERNLYLATQLAELGVPLVLAFNMSDIAEARGHRVDDRMLSELLGVPIVRTVGHKGRGIARLLAAAVEVAADPAGAVARQHRPDYGGEIEPHLRDLARRASEVTGDERHRRWFAIKLLENDAETRKRIADRGGAGAADLLDRADRLRRHVERICGDAAEIVLADRRYGFISGACTEAVTATVEARHERSDRIDAVLTNRYVGLPLFAMMMYLVFQVTFAVGNPLVDALDAGKSALADAVRALDPSGESLLVSLLAGGIIEGVGAVLVFVPLIVLLYLAIGILEDSGYMARAAFILDGLMHRIGLHGKSFIPLLVGFGCNVPGIMATRILESRRDRLTTMLVLPLMSCGARLPVYVLILAAFFPSRVLFRPLGLFAVTNQALLLFGLYFLGIALAVAATKVFRSTLFRGEVAPLVMELPPYRRPTARGLAVHAGERTWAYIRKAGTIILAITIVMWALRTWPRPSDQMDARFARQREELRQTMQPEIDAAEGARRAALRAEYRSRLGQIEHRAAQAELEHSAIGRIGKAAAPALEPCGFDWKVTTALIPAFLAKEVFIAQMGVIYAVGGEADEESAPLRQRLRATYTPLMGLSLMVFILIASPCAPTVAVTARESGSWKWALLQWSYLTALAWVLSAGLFQVGKLIGY